jgi:putative tryptophan/tyrosine transport system substrate-binding protein
MRRREFISLVGAFAAIPHAARAEPPIIGFLHTRAKENLGPTLGGFIKGLSEAGYVEGRSIKIEYRFVNGQYDRLPTTATELVGQRIAVLVAGGGAESVAAAKAAATMPVVFIMGSDPVKAGFVASYNRPGGNMTGVNILTDTL